MTSLVRSLLFFFSPWSLVTLSHIIAPCLFRADESAAKVSIMINMFISTLWFRLQSLDNYPIIGCGLNGGQNKEPKRGKGHLSSNSRVGLIIFFWSGLFAELSWSPFLEAWPPRQCKAVIMPERSGGRRERNSQHSAWRIAECSEVGWEWRRSLWAPNSPPDSITSYVCISLSRGGTLGLLNMYSHMYVHCLTCGEHMDFHAAFQSLSHWNLIIQELHIVNKMYLNHVT